MSASFRDFTPDDAVSAAAAALARDAGTPVVIEDCSRIGDEQRRNHVIRGVARDAIGSRRNIIIKATRAAGYDAAAEDAVVRNGIAREWAAASLLDRRGACTARLLAADAATGVLVFSDLGADAAWLVAPLLHGSASEAEAALLAYAISLARLHAATVDCLAAYSSIVREAFPHARIPLAIGDAWLADAAGKASSLLGGSLPDSELALLRRRMQDPGRWLALVHGDACPDNVLLTAQGAALLDFEFAAPGHALVDATYWRLGFPTCWCAGRIPDTVADRIEQAYRDALAAVIPEAQDTASYWRDYAAAVFVRLFASLGWNLANALKADEIWGRAGLRSRILWHLQAAIEAAERGEALSELRRVAQDWLTGLRQSWPEAQPLPLYPAFAVPQEG